MPKTKTHSGTKKRTKVTSSGKVLVHHVGMRHNLGSMMTKKQKRRLNKDMGLHPGDEKRIKHLLS